jgi:1-acyl-sn-glycerol-3-phosphate acyltransferase
MPIPPSIARALASLYVSDEEFERLADLHYQDAGHGFDAFGLHPDFVALGELVAGPIYDHWFRVISRGHESIPDVGPAVIAGNHSGNIPIDAAMIWMDVLRNTSPPRVPRAIADHFVPSLPFVGTLFARSGMIGGSRGNTRALLESGELLLIFPEGTPGIIKPWAERYQLRPFRVGHAELAIRHGAPIVPVGVIGAEEQLPLLHVSKRLGKPLGVPEVPIPAVPFPLPVRYRIFYGDPIPVHEEFAPSDADDPDVVRIVAGRVQAAVDRLIKQGLSERKGVFV